MSIVSWALMLVIESDVPPNSTQELGNGVVWWMILPFYQYPIWPMVFICPDDPPEAAELLDYFDSTYISGRQHKIKQSVWS
jgi:hypothetical protein